MNQQKIGTFLKDLRSEKNITQEQISFVMVIMGAVMTSKYAARIYEFKKSVKRFLT